MKFFKYDLEEIVEENFLKKIEFKGHKKNNKEAVLMLGLFVFSIGVMCCLLLEYRETFVPWLQINSKMSTCIFLLSMVD